MEGEKEAWWLDDRTKRLIEQTMHLNGALTFTVRPGTPLQLTREQVRTAVSGSSCRKHVTHRAGEAAVGHSGKLACAATSIDTLQSRRCRASMIRSGYHTSSANWSTC